ncbi:MAG: TolC family protein [Bacteroidaceae bacterium]|nr:TolC family protein [Bacteroidaceae bacterium]
MNRHIVTYSALMLIMVTPVCMRAQTLTLQQCIDMALADNKQLAKSNITQQQMEYNVNTYKSNFYPRIDLFMTDMYSTAKADFTIKGGQLPIYNYVEALGTFVPNVTPNADGSYSLNQYALFPDQQMKLKIKNMFIGGISLTQPIYMGGKISTAYNMALIGKAMSETSHRLTQDNVVVQTIEAYVMAVKAKEMIDVMQRYKELLDELKKNVDSALRHGMKTRNDVMKVQVKLNEADLNISKAENAYTLAKMNLCHYIGRPLTSDISVTADNLTPISFSTQPGIDISQRPEYGLLQQQVSLATEGVKLTRSDFLPQVVLMGGYTYAHGGELAGRRLLSDGAASVGIGVKVPIVNFGEGSNKIRSAKAKQTIAQLEQADLSEQMMLEQQQALQALDEAQKELTLTESALSQAEENMRLSRQQYEVGYETLSDYLEAQAMWQQAYAAKVEARCQQVLATYKYKKSRGQILP